MTTQTGIELDPKHGFKVAYPDVEKHTAAGLGRVARLPRILDPRPGMHLEASMYLVERGLAQWRHGKQIPTAGWRPSEESMHTFATWLLAFLEWCSLRGYDPCKVAGDKLYEFQADLQNGRFSRDGKRHAGKTTNVYVDIAEDYLHWLASKGLREEVILPTITKSVSTPSATRAAARRTQTIEVRAGRVRVHPAHLSMPKSEEVDRWLEERYQLDETTGLMCELVIDSGPRRQSVADWRVDTLPKDPRKWRIANPEAHPDDHQVSVVLRFGVKGPDQGERVDGDKVGPDYHLKIPLRLARKLHDYRENVRPILLKPYIRKGRSLSEQRERRDSVHLFRKEDGGRVTAKTFYHAWKKGTMPCETWHPHLGRHYWACMLLWQHYLRHRESFGRDLLPNADALYGWAESVIRMHIQPGLNHAHFDTSFIYLRWFSDMVGIPLPEHYQLEMHRSTPHADAG